MHCFVPGVELQRRAQRNEDTKPADNDDNGFDKYLENYLKENPKSKVMQTQPTGQEEMNEVTR